MATRHSPLAHFFATIVLIAGLGIFVLGFLISYVLCIDRIDEYMNGWQYQNKWVPFRGGYLNYVLQLPAAIIGSFQYFPLACFASLLFYPLIIVLLPVMDLFLHGDYELMLMGWGPLFAGSALVLFAVAVKSP